MCPLTNIIPPTGDIESLVLFLNDLVNERDIVKRGKWTVEDINKDFLKRKMNNMNPVKNVFMKKYRVYIVTWIVTTMYVNMFIVPNETPICNIGRPELINSECNQKLKKKHKKTQKLELSHETKCHDY